MAKILPALLLVLSSVTYAQETYSIHAGAAKGEQRLTLNKHYEFKTFTDRITIEPELGVSFWHGDNGNAVQLSATPMFRWNVTDRFFAELGVGLSWFSKKDFANGTPLSTNFQFSDHLGFGYKIGHLKTIGLRLSHFSNAGIKKPNPGLESLQLTYSQGL